MAGLGSPMPLSILQKGEEHKIKKLKRSLAQNLHNFLIPFSSQKFAIGGLGDVPQEASKTGINY